MQNKVNSIIQAIETKRLKLRQDAERDFSSISISVPSNSFNTQSVPKSTTPPISYILYGLAGVSAVGVLGSDSGFSKLLCCGIAAACVYGGYKFTNTKSTNQTVPNTSVSIDTQKNEVKSKIVESVKRITSEWESFMEIQQKDLQNAILSSGHSEQEKDNMQSKVFVYEIIDFSLSDVNRAISSVTDSTGLKQQVLSIKNKMLSAIDNAVNKQMEKYRSVCI